MQETAAATGVGAGRGDRESAKEHWGDRNALLIVVTGFAVAIPSSQNVSIAGVLC